MFWFWAFFFFPSLEHVKFIFELIKKILSRPVYFLSSFERQNMRKCGLFYHFFLSFLLNGYWNTDNSMQEKVEEQVLPPCPAHQLPDISTQMAEPAKWCNRVGNLPKLSPQTQGALMLRTVEAGVNHSQWWPKLLTE